METIERLHYHPTPSRSRDGDFITVIPSEHHVTPNFGSLATVPVGTKARKTLPGSHPVPIAAFYASSNTELFAPSRAESEPCRHPYV